MNEIKSKHIDLIQSIISRMASNSFMMKGWAVTILAAIFVLSTKEAIPCFAFIAIIPNILFWVLDSYYLQNERRYRQLYKTIVANEPDEKLSLEMTKPNCREKTTFIQAMFSKTEWLFYVAMTRAKNRLVFSYVKIKGGKEILPSRFVDELLEK